MCCILCFDDSPVAEGPRYGYTKPWAVNMLNAPCANPLWFCGGYFCAPCAQYRLRSKALNNDLSQYKCCQGYMDCLCFRAGELGEAESPECCLCIESCCCLHFAVQATRFYLMDGHNVRRLAARTSALGQPASVVTTRLPSPRRSRPRPTR